MQKDSSMRKVFGVGINDSDFPVSTLNSDGKQETIKSYKAWKNMLGRCYCKKTQERQPTYKGCYVSKEWHLFSNFNKWYTENYINGFQIDKDILVEGNRAYGPDTCVFVSRQLNTLFLDGGSSRVDRHIGTCYIESRKKYKTKIRKFGKRYFIGYFDTHEEAYIAYKKEKNAYILEFCKGNRYFDNENILNIILKRISKTKETL